MRLRIPPKKNPSKEEALTKRTRTLQRPRVGGGLAGVTRLLGHARHPKVRDLRLHPAGTRAGGVLRYEGEMGMGGRTTYEDVSRMFLAARSRCTLQERQSRKCEPLKKKSVSHRGPRKHPRDGDLKCVSAN